MTRASRNHRKVPEHIRADGAPDAGPRAGLVGAHLRRMFDDIASEPLPERLETLLARLAAEEAGAERPLGEEAQQ